MKSEFIGPVENKGRTLITFHMLPSLVERVKRLYPEVDFANLPFMDEAQALASALTVERRIELYEAMNERCASEPEIVPFSRDVIINAVIQYWLDWKEQQMCPTA